MEATCVLTLQDFRLLFLGDMQLSQLIVIYCGLLLSLYRQLDTCAGKLDFVKKLKKDKCIVTAPLTFKNVHLHFKIFLHRLMLRFPKNLGAGLAQAV
jgi:hypothetical protein